jgi:hypothetical protein
LYGPDDVVDAPAYGVSSEEGSNDNQNDRKALPSHLVSLSARTRGALDITYLPASALS